MQADDPFASITRLCLVSSSQEDHLRHCPFVGEPEMEKETESQDSGEATLECTAIMMMSAPDSSEDNDHDDDKSSRDDDVFQTPPEGSLIASSEGNRNNRTVTVEEEKGEKTVDLGADTDLGFSEVELTQRLDDGHEVIYCEYNRVSVTNRCLRMPQSKRPKITNEKLGSESPNQRLDAELGDDRENVIKPSEKLSSYRVIPDSCGSESKSPQNTQISEGSSVKRKLDFSTEVIELETEASDRDLGLIEGLENNERNGEGNSNLGEKNIDDIDKYRYGGPSGHNSCEVERNKQGNPNLGEKNIDDIEKYRYGGPTSHNSFNVERNNRGMRALPVSICGQAENNAGKEQYSRKHYEEITLLDVLRMLTANNKYDSSFDNKSILDVAKSRGMTFP